MPSYDSLDPRTWPEPTPDVVRTPVHVLFVIDSSGSMAPKASDVRGGFNSYVSNLGEDMASEYRLTAVTFDTQVTTLFTDVTLNQVPALDTSNYRPGGNTALYDALGVSLSELTSAIRREAKPYGIDKTLVIVMTDGEENSSRRFTKEQINSEIKLREDAGNWTFVYLGADQDAWPPHRGWVSRWGTWPRMRQTALGKSSKVSRAAPSDSALVRLPKAQISARVSTSPIRLRSPRSPRSREAQCGGFGLTVQAVNFPS